MKKYSILSIILFLCCHGLTFSQTEPIFNGVDLRGWTIYGTEKWYVEDGLLVCESGPDKKYGYLGTEKEYVDLANFFFKMGLVLFNIYFVIYMFYCYSFLSMFFPAKRGL